MKLTEQIKALENKIKAVYEEGVTLDEAEKLAAEFLYAQLIIAGELTKSDLDARMRKSGLKVIRANAYLEVVGAADKKPTEAQIAALIDGDSLVVTEQNGLDKAEVGRSDLERYYDIFGNAHIYFRGIAKGKFE